MRRQLITLLPRHTRTVRPLQPLRSEESHSGTTEPRPSRPQSSPRPNPCSGCTRGSPERRRSSPSEPEILNIGTSLVTMGRRHVKGKRFGAREVLEV
ncbi:hypothetical protein F2Q68_00021377 [Brassica cretica]|uniref:Uncharacterized protein n=1 Tax=Brassica cretica TaxID=69181 RepID=A0A8S9FMT8_BRACR|nr:hypothetical protein F2Q68_00021377 [Brassica cretica]